MLTLQTINEYQQKLNLSSSEAHAALHQIGEQIRQISTKLEEQYSHEVKFLAPLRELLNTEFEKQLDKPKFKWLQSLNINNYVVDFDEVKDDSLTSDHKVQICNFMIEAICNIDKYAISVSTVWITSKVEGDYCLLEIRDNGKATIDLNRKGYGVRSAEKLGKKLKGKFWRESLTPHGYRCTLSWKYVN